MTLIDCHKCHVLINGGKMRLEGRVVHTKQSVKIFFNTHSLRDARIKSKVIFYDDQQGILTGVCELLFKRNPSFIKNQEPWMAECTILELQRDERNLRNAVRIKTNIEVEFRSSNHGGFYGTLKDLSVGGFRLVSRQILDRNERIAFSYAFSGPVRQFEALVIRGTLLEDGKYGYGCRFVRLSDQAESAIGGYLFKRQQQMRSEQT